MTTALDEPFILGSAALSTVVPAQWAGTMAAEEGVLRNRSLYEITELDRHDWTFIGIELRGGSAHLRAREVTLYAVHHPEGIHGHDELLALAAGGAFPVTRIAATDQRADRILNEVMKSYILRLTHRGAEGTPLEVTHEMELPAPA